MPESTLDETTLRQWIGKSETATDTLAPKQARLLELTLDREASLENGDLLPPCWHWIYFLGGAKQSGLGRDGHAALGEFLPPVDLPRRMWAGGRISFDHPIKLGETIEKRSTIKDVKLKKGKSGTLCFVTVLHELINGSGTVCLSEEQDLVYRDDPAPDAPAPSPVPPPENEKSSETITPSEVQLFRYSALTFNGHRIHYDRSYCEQVEGYPGLIYHGPLSATVLADRAINISNRRTLKKFDFRAVAPLFDTQPFTLHDDGENTLWTETPQGGLAMRAQVEID